MENAVFCRSVESYRDARLASAVEEIFAQSPAAGALNERTSVLLKPNLLAKHAPEHAVTTHPAVLRAVLQALKRRGVTRITLADSPGGVYNAGTMQSIYRASGLAAVCEEQGAALYNACKARETPIGGALLHTCSVIEPVGDADFIINLPKLKTHAMAGLTCAVKNLFGVIPGLQKAELHMRFPEKERFGDMLVDLCEAVRPQLTIVDGVVGMEGDGPAGGAPRAVGLIFGGENPYTIDLFAARLIQIDPLAVPYLEAAHRRGICAAEFDPALAAELLPAPIADFKLPSSYGDLSTDFAKRMPRALQGVTVWGRRLLAPRPRINRAACVGCGKCAEICPAHTIAITGKKAKIAPKACIRCFCCHEMCPVKAIDVKRFALFNL